jgi:hypothetical protein
MAGAVIGLGLAIALAVGQVSAHATRVATSASGAVKSTPVIPSHATAGWTSAASSLFRQSLGASGSLTASSVPPHVETMTWDDNDHVPGSSCDGGYTAHAPLVQHWLTYALDCSVASGSKAIQDCHPSSGGNYCTTFTYTDPNFYYPPWGPKDCWSSMTLPANVPEDWWLHEPGFTDSAHRLNVHGDNCPVTWVFNQLNPAFDAWFDQWARASYNGFDGLWLDDTAPSMKAQFYDSGYGTSQEIGTDTLLRNSHVRLAAALTHTNGSSFLILYNGDNPNPYELSPFPPPLPPLIDDPSNAVGYEMENEPWAYSCGGASGCFAPWYSSLLDQVAYVDNEEPAGYFLALHAEGAGTTARLVQEATILLGYSPTHLVDWADLDSQATNLHVFPEEGIYPTEPVQSMGAPSDGSSGPCLTGNGQLCTSGGHNDVQVLPGTDIEHYTGVFRREFAACYNHGVLFGQCAAIVNNTAHPVTVKASWLRQAYGHQITLIGGDVESHGSIDLTGATFTAGVTQVPAQRAMLLAR